MKRSDTKLIERLAAGENITRAAKLTGFSRRTVTRRLADPEFRQKMLEVRRQIVDQAAGQMAASAAAASVTLRKLLRCESHGIRFQAARAILELAVKLRDATELEERITALETVLANRLQMATLPSDNPNKSIYRGA